MEREEQTPEISNRIIKERTVLPTASEAAGTCVWSSACASSSIDPGNLEREEALLDKRSAACRPHLVLTFWKIRCINNFLLKSFRDGDYFLWIHTWMQHLHTAAALLSELSLKH